MFPLQVFLDRIKSNSKSKAYIMGKVTFSLHEIHSICDINNLSYWLFLLVLKPSKGTDDLKENTVQVIKTPLAFYHLEGDTSKLTAVAGFSKKIKFLAIALVPFSKTKWGIVGHVCANKITRDFKKTTTATGMSLNKRFNEQNNARARVL